MENRVLIFAGDRRDVRGWSVYRNPKTGNEVLRHACGAKREIPISEMAPEKYAYQIATANAAAEIVKDWNLG